MGDGILTIKPEADKITVEFPRDALSGEALQRYLDLLKAAFFAQQSTLTEADADQLADEMKADWWHQSDFRRLIQDDTISR